MKDGYYISLGALVKYENGLFYQYNEDNRFGTNDNWYLKHEIFYKNLEKFAKPISDEDVILELL